MRSTSEGMIADNLAGIATVTHAENVVNAVYQQEKC